VSAYLANRPRWSRATIAFHVQCLRTLFRHGANRGWCRPGFAETIEAPRLYTHERLDINTIGAWLGHVSIDTTNVYAEVDLETKAQMLAACGSFSSGKPPARRWRDDPSLMQFLRSL
jgi:hypothetical protein